MHIKRIIQLGFRRTEEVDRTFIVRKFILIFLIVGISLTGCTTLIERSADTELAPTATPEITLPHYLSGQPITNQQEAISAALDNLKKSRLHYQSVPKVVSAEKKKAKDARKQFKEEGITVCERRSDDTMVWVVLFEGEWQIIPPNPSHTETPPPFTQGCVYVIMDASDGGEAEVGGIDCTP